ncbi:hypothetical protein CC80DRAFT_392331, partial [Byssothecium circinans]
KFARFGSLNDCDPPSHSPSRLPWGIDRIYRMVKLTAEGADIMETVIMPSFTYHDHTFSSSALLGEVNILTSDPENVITIFSTSFKDFPTGSRR